MMMMAKIITKTMFGRMLMMIVVILTIMIVK